MTTMQDPQISSVSSSLPKKEENASWLHEGSSSFPEIKRSLSLARPPAFENQDVSDPFMISPIFNRHRGMQADVTGSNRRSHSLSDSGPLLDTEVAFAVLQNLSVPLFVLSNFKTIVFANGAMHDWFAKESFLENDNVSNQDCHQHPVRAATLYGLSLSQLSINPICQQHQRWSGWEV